MNSTPNVEVLGDPTGARAAAVIVKYAAPDYVLSAPPSDLFGTPRFRSNFADREMKYPISTKAAAWTSAAGYLDTGDHDPAVLDRLKYAFTYHRIPAAEWERLEKAAAESQPPPRTPASYALPTAQKYPLDTPDQVKAAVAYFQKYADRFDPDSRRVYAENVVKAAGDILPPELLRRLEAEAGMAMPNPLWRTEFDVRVKMAKDHPEVRAALEKTANSLAGSIIPIGQFRTAGELANLLRQVDQRMGWELPDPLPGLTGETPSTARAKLAAAVEGADGSWYATTDLDRLPAADFVNLFGGNPVASREAKAAALRDPATAELMSKVLRDHGVDPVSRARPKTDWAALAGRS